MKILKCITVAVLLILLGVSSLQGSDTRVTNMGYLANLYLRDNYNIWAFPSTLANYRNLIVVDSYAASGSDALWSGGIHLPLGENLTVGIYLSNNTWDLDWADTQFNARTIFYNLSSTEASHQYTIFGAYRMTNLDIGLYVSSFSSKETYTDPDNSDFNYDESLGAREFAFGISTKGNERTRLDATIYYGTGNFKRVVTGNDPSQSIAPEGYNSYGILARLFYAYTSKIIIVPFAGYGREGQGYRSLVPDASLLTYVSKQTMYLLGCGVDLIPFERALITMATGLHRYASTYEQTWSSGTPPPSPEYSSQTLPFLTVGLEARLARWLGARFSFFELLDTYVGKMDMTGDDVLEETKFTGSSYAAYFGLWFNWSRFTIDALVDMNGAANFLHHGPYVVSGVPLNPLVAQLSVIYNFSANRTN